MRALLGLIASVAILAAMSADAATSNEELAQMHREDQADREPGDGTPINWTIVTSRDAARLKRTLELYRSGELRTGEDLYRAAMILQHGHEPEHYLLAHELCVTAVFAHASEGGDCLTRAKWLAAASEDRFLRSIDREQRFGTQFHGDDVEYSLEAMDDDVTDAVRLAWNVPTLQEAKAREAELTRQALAQLRKPEARSRLLQLPIDDPSSVTTLMRIVREHGWPGADAVGFKACNVAFAILRRAPSSVVKSVLPALQAAADTDLMTSVNAAIIEDRLLIEAGEPQLYGTAASVAPDGTVTVAPVQDPEHLDARRAARGLPTMEEFLKQLKANANPAAHP